MRGVAALLLVRLAAASIPAHILPHWDARPTVTPSDGCVDGPVVGNGAVAAAITSVAAGDLRVYIDRNDAWVPATGDISACGYDLDNAGGRTLGLTQLSFNGTDSFQANQFIENGTVTTVQGSAIGGEIRTESFVARGVDVLVTTISWMGGPVGLSQNVTVRTTQNDRAQADFCHSFSAGTNGTVAFATRQLGWPYQNVKTSTIGRRHFYKATWASTNTQV